MKKDSHLQHHFTLSLILVKTMAHKCGQHIASVRMARCIPLLDRITGDSTSVSTGNRHINGKETDPIILPIPIRSLLEGASSLLIHPTSVIRTSEGTTAVRHVTGNNEATLEIKSYLSSSASRYDAGSPNAISVITSNVK